jgi:hypothetical protein
MRELREIFNENYYSVKLCEVSIRWHRFLGFLDFSGDFRGNAIVLLPDSETPALLFAKLLMGYSAGQTRPPEA